MSFTGTIVPCCALILTTLCLTTQAQPNIVISQIYGGGGNTGATLRYDFVELFNRGNARVSVTGWTVQYASASGATWDRAPLSGSIQAGQYYLLHLAQGTGGSARLPSADATGGLNLSATSGKVALGRVHTNKTIDV